MADHPDKVGVYRFTVPSLGQAGIEDAAGHTANEAFVRARPALSVLLARDATLNDVESKLIENNCLTPFVDKAAAEWNLDPKEVLVPGHRTRQKREARAACLLMASEHWSLDIPTLARATGWSVSTVADMIRSAKGRGGRAVRERLAKMGAAA